MQAFIYLTEVMKNDEIYMMFSVPTLENMP